MHSTQSSITQQGSDPLSLLPDEVFLSALRAMEASPILSNYDALGIDRDFDRRIEEELERCRPQVEALTPTSAGEFEAVVINLLGAQIQGETAQRYRALLSNRALDLLCGAGNYYIFEGNVGTKIIAVGDAGPPTDQQALHALRQAPNGTPPLDDIREELGQFALRSAQTMFPEFDFSASNPEASW